MITAPGSRMEIICADLDSTLADTRQRRRFCPTVDPTSTWDKYGMLCGRDAPIAGPIRALRMFHALGYGVHLVSNSSERTRALRVSWLREHEVPYEVLRLRGAHEPIDNDIKVDYLAEVQTAGFEVLLFLEDWPPTAAAIEARGVPVLCINPRYGDTG